MKNNLHSEISKIVNETIARTCSLFGGSLSDLEPEDQEIEIKAIDAILALIKKHEREYGRDILLRLKKPFKGAYLGNDQYDWEKLEELFAEEFKDLSGPKEVEK